MCQSTSWTLLRRVNFIRQADGWWSRVDHLDPWRRLLSAQNRKLTLHEVASGILIALISQQSASCLSVNHAMFAVECLNHQTSEAKSVWRDGSSCSWFNPNSHHAVMFIKSQVITRVDVRAKCICTIMRCMMESELKCNAFPDLFVGENVVDT